MNKEKESDNKPNKPGSKWKYLLIVISIIFIGMGLYDAITDSIDYCESYEKYNTPAVAETEANISSSSDEVKISDDLSNSEIEAKDQILSQRYSTNPFRHILGTIMGVSISTIMRIALVWAVYLLIKCLLIPFVKNSIQQTSIIKPEDINVSFEDIIGLDEIKDDIAFYVSLLANNVQEENEERDYVPHGILLEGPPGNGKTMLAKALAREANINFIAINSSEIESPFVGISSQTIKNTFDIAKENAPCIVFFDEIDAIGCHRVHNVQSAVDKEENATLTTLLNQLDGFRELKGVMVIAATNMASCLDPALLRPGRFDKRYTIGNPDYHTRIQLFEKLSRRFEIRESLDISRFATKTYGFNCAQINNVVNEAKLIALKEERAELTPQDFDKAITQIQIHGVEKKEYDVSEFDKRTAAYHEAGHAIIGYYKKDKIVSQISIKPTTSGAGGFTLIEESEQNNLKPIKSIKDRITILYGGRAAEAKLYGGIENASKGSSQDIQYATSLAAECVGFDNGIDYSAFGEVGLKEVMEESKRILDVAWTEAQEIVNKHWSALEEVAGELMKCETVSADRFNEIMNICT